MPSKEAYFRISNYVLDSGSKKTENLVGSVQFANHDCTLWNTRYALGPRKRFMNVIFYHLNVDNS